MFSTRMTLIIAVIHLITCSRNVAEKQYLSDHINQKWVIIVTGACSYLFIVIFLY
jgi:hypothetical protein